MSQGCLLRRKEGKSCQWLEEIKDGPGHSHCGEMKEQTDQRNVVRMLKNIKGPDETSSQECMINSTVIATIL